MPGVAALASIVVYIESKQLSDGARYPRRPTLSFNDPVTVSVHIKSYTAGVYSPYST